MVLTASTLVTAVEAMRFAIANFLLFNATSPSQAFELGESMKMCVCFLCTGAPVCNGCVWSVRR